MATTAPAPLAPEKITFRFCRECSNMLYPKEALGDKSLMMACRSCSYREPATTACIFRQELSEKAKDTAGVTDDVFKDPTLPRSASHPCPACRNPTSVYFQSQQRTKHTGMHNYHVCGECGHVWNPQPSKEELRVISDKKKKREEEEKKKEDEKDKK